MSERRTHIVETGQSGMRLDALLGSLEPIPSRSAAAKMIDAGQVYLNGQPASKKQQVQAGDRVVFPLPEREEGDLRGEPIPLDIRYEDEHLIVLSKQMGLVCHPSAGHETGTLVNALIWHCGIESLGTLQGDDRPGIVHRLDKDTTGLMLAAKNDDAQASLQDMIRIRSLDRRYIALVHGVITPDTGLIDAPIARGKKNRMRMEISDLPNARSSVTTFNVLERFDAGQRDEGYTLLECKLYTGRTHQIRVHMSSFHHPCVGDQLYGAYSLQANLGLSRQFLHSWHLSLAHPITGVPLEFFDPIPDDLAAALSTIADRTRGRTSAGDEILKQALL